MRRKRKNAAPSVKVKPGKDSMTFVKMGTMNDGKTKGMIFRHGFGTGFQDLVFPNIEQAQRFADALNPDIVRIKKKNY
jgi:hypothetical protein